MSKNCKIVQDLLPLYVEKISSNESNQFIENHLKDCNSCNEVLNILNKDEKVSKVAEKEAIKKFNLKLKHRNIKIIFISIFLIILIAFIGWYFLYANEYTIKYTDNLVKVVIPEDEGIDILINKKNYKNANAILVKTDENIYDIYINVTQNILTKLFEDSDQSNNLIRIGNNICIDFQSEKVRFYLPDNNKINNIYYVEDNYEKIKDLSNE